MYVYIILAQNAPELIVEHSNFKNWGACPQTPYIWVNFHTISPPSHISSPPPHPPPHHPKTSSYATLQAVHLPFSHCTWEVCIQDLVTWCEYSAHVQLNCCAHVIPRAYWPQTKESMSPWWYLCCPTVQNSYNSMVQTKFHSKSRDQESPFSLYGRMLQMSLHDSPVPQ